jgi:hypothetical protein
MKSSGERTRQVYTKSRVMSSPYVKETMINFGWPCITMHTCA